jgi:two-component system cell cycle response regulator
MMGAPMARWQTYRIDQHPDYSALPREYCTLTMIRGPMPGAIQPVADEPVVLGREDSLPARIDDEGLSRVHAKVFREGTDFFVEDLDSTNGTRINGSALTTRRKLEDGDRIQLGHNTVLRVALLDTHEHEAQQRLYASAIFDPLTQVFNRGYFEHRLVAEFAFSRRHHTPLAILLVDLDHFKSINDTYGHQAGDEALRAMAGALRNTVRVEDVLARYGGEEFVVIARGIDRGGAMLFAERIRETIERTPFEHRGVTLRVTASVGVAALGEGTAYGHSAELVAAADRAVYRAKNEGRNRAASEPA